MLLGYLLWPPQFSEWTPPVSHDLWPCLCPVLSTHGASTPSQDLILLGFSLPVFPKLPSGLSLVDNKVHTILGSSWLGPVCPGRLTPWLLTSCPISCLLKSFSHFQVPQGRVLFSDHSYEGFCEDILYSLPNSYNLLSSKSLNFKARFCPFLTSLFWANYCTFPGSWFFFLNLI